MARAGTIGDMGDSPFVALPSVGAWRLSGAYEGFEVVRFTSGDGEVLLDGDTVGVEDGVPWSIHYTIEVADDWRVRAATVSDHSGRRVDIRADGSGSWQVDGEDRPELDGCLDLDLEASVVTNTLPVHRLALDVGQRGESAAVCLRTVGLTVERLDQSYERLPDDTEGHLAIDYESPRFGFREILRFAPDGLVVTYPGIGSRVPVTVPY